MTVPATNNGQEGSNRRFGEDFGVHPSLWSFILTMNEELENSNEDIRSILFGTKNPPPNEMYTFLKEEREVMKANYNAGLISLDDFLGKLGALSMKAAKQKVASDAEPGDAESLPTKKNKRKASDKESTAPKSKRGRRGKLPLLAKKTTGSSLNASNHTAGLGSSPMILSSNISSENLPWPITEGLVERIALPSTAARTVASAVPTEPARAMLRTPAVNIETSIGSNDSLMAHISKYGLGLRPRATIPGDGNCWYSSNVDLIKEFKLKAPLDHLELRKAVVNSMKNHPQMRQWVQSVFHGKKRDYNRFLKEQSQPGVFTDSNGLAVIATADYLGVNYHIVGTSNTEKAPVSKYGRLEEDRPVLHIGYYQDNTDVPNVPKRRAGHYQSLEVVPGSAVEFCGVAADALVHLSPPLITIQTATPDRGTVVSKIVNEETILKVLASQQSIVGPSLQRLLDIKSDITIDSLFETEICPILMQSIRPVYNSSSEEGKKCRKLLKYFQQLCRKDPNFDNEELPNITDVSDSDSEVPPPTRSFRSLFQANQSGSILMAGSDRVENEVLDELPETFNCAASSSTVMKPKPTKRKRGRPEALEELEEETSEDPEIILTPPPPTPPPAKRGRGRPALAEISTEPDVVLTPPPPTSPPTKRGRGRPRKIL